jgi:N6-adenosine-specific RNA methylase IME4
MEFEPLPEGKFDVLYADPNWTFKTFSEKGKDKSADKHYACSPIEQISAMPVANSAAKNCVLFLWATAPLLPQQLGVMERWGFKYKSHFIWDKRRVGTGYWARNQHELLLIGTRGKPKCPAPPERIASVLSEKRREHSRKPEAAIDWINKTYPHPEFRKLEMFCRQRRFGWEAWGNQLDHFPSEQSEIEEAIKRAA